jgi:hypothetical protein
VSHTAKVVVAGNATKTQKSVPAGTLFRLECRYQGLRRISVGVAAPSPLNAGQIDW